MVYPGVELSGPAQGSLAIHAPDCIYPTAKAENDEQNCASEVQKRRRIGGKIRLFL